ncbi:MAG: transcriptional repressor, partial [Verrucomicrobia bacterium]|nr:transcriptional repressor [Verrucomicrobiota bacterium]
EALVGWGLVKQVNLDRAPTRYCANLQEHSHFQCESCGAIFDVEMPFDGTWSLPEGFIVSHADVFLKGLCARCSARSGASASASAPTPVQQSIFENKIQRSNS